MRIRSILVLLILTQCPSFAQSNTFPPSGNVGLGTTSPTDPLHINKSVNGELNLLIQNTYINGARTFISSLPGKSSIQTDKDFTISTNGGGWSDKLILTNSGNVGIGTTTPLARLHVAGSIWSNATRTNTVFNGNINSDYANFVGSEGYWALRSATNNALHFDVYNFGNPRSALSIEQNGSINIGSNIGGDTGYGPSLNFAGWSTNGDYLWLARYNNGNNKSELRINIGDDYGQQEDMFAVGTHHWNGGTWYSHLSVHANGRVGIGTTSPDASLTVKGDIHTQEVKGDLNGSVAPDYVFEKDYSLTSLEKLKSYIDQNKHLPEIPSAKEMEEEGINLKEMNLLLLKKVEELTLHLIQKEDEVRSLRASSEASLRNLEQVTLRSIDQQEQINRLDDLIKKLTTAK